MTTVKLLMTDFFFSCNLNIYQESVGAREPVHHVQTIVNQTPHSNVSEHIFHNEEAPHTQHVETTCCVLHFVVQGEVSLVASVPKRWDNLFISEEVMATGKARLVADQTAQTFPEKRCLAACGLTPWRFSRAHKCALCCLNTPSRVKYASSVKKHEMGN